MAFIIRRATKKDFVAVFKLIEVGFIYNTKRLTFNDKRLMLNIK